MYHGFILKDAIVNQETYKVVLTHLQETFHLKHPEMWVAKYWMILHGDAPECWSLLVW
jgi:hypothetical protein